MDNRFSRFFIFREQFLIDQIHSKCMPTYIVITYSTLKFYINGIKFARSVTIEVSAAKVIS